MTDEPDPDEPESEEDEEQPEIDDEEMADFAAVADEIEDEASADDGDQEEGEAEESDDTDDLSLDDAGDRVSVGDVYCNALGMGAAVSRARFGSADPTDRGDLVDEYGDMARELQIDEYVDQWLAENGGMDELTPGQAILMSTLLFGGMVVMDDPEIVDNAVAEVGS